MSATLEYTYRYPFASRLEREGSAWGCGWRRLAVRRRVVLQVRVRRLLRHLVPSPCLIRFSLRGDADHHAWWRICCWLSPTP